MDKLNENKKYCNIPLGYGAVSDTKDNYYIEDFLDKKKIIDFIYNLFDHNTVLTKSGFKFLEEYYGLDKIADILLKEDPKYPYDNKDEIIEWLKIKGEYAIED